MSNLIMYHLFRHRFILFAHISTHFELGDRDDLHQVFVAGLVFDEEYQLMPAAVFGGVVLAVQILADEDFCADDRLDAVVFCLALEFHGTIEGGGIRECDRRHAEFLGLRQKLLDLRQSGEQ